MGIIRLTLIATALALVLGLFFGYQLGIKKRDNLLIELQKQHIKVYEKERKKTTDYKAIAEKNYQDYLAASNREPDVITERVYVKATCPTLPTNTNGSVADAEAGRTAELHRDTVRSITELSQKWQKEYSQCRVMLHSLQDTIRIFNNG